jgi:hypothetical protein
MNKLTKAERKLLVSIGRRWMKMSPSMVLSESAVLFILSVGIAGEKLKNKDRR